MVILKAISDAVNEGFFIAKKRHLAELQYHALKYGIDFNGPMSGINFEKGFAELLRRFGAGDVVVTQQNGDYGIDVIVNGAGGKSVFQCKWYNGNVGIKSVQEAYAGKTYYGADNAYVVTNSYFTNNAIVLAKSTGVILWNRDVLLYLIETVKNKEIEWAKIKKQEKAKFTMYCSNCGTPLRIGQNFCSGCGMAIQVIGTGVTERRVKQ